MQNFTPRKCTLDLRGWQPGLYVATLVVGGVSQQSRRFVVGE